MDNFEFTAQSYEQIIAKPDTSDELKQHLKVQITALRAISGKSDSEIAAIFNTGAFNDIVRGYVKKALVNTNLAKELVEDVLGELNYLFDAITAEEAKK